MKIEIRKDKVFYIYKKTLLNNKFIWVIISIKMYFYKSSLIVITLI